MLISAREISLVESIYFSFQNGLLLKKTIAFTHGAEIASSEKQILSFLGCTLLRRDLYENGGKTSSLNFSL